MYLLTSLLPFFDKIYDTDQSFPDLLPSFWRNPRRCKVLSIFLSVLVSWSIDSSSSFVQPMNFSILISIMPRCSFLLLGFCYLVCFHVFSYPSKIYFLFIPFVSLSNLLSHIRVPLRIYSISLLLLFLLYGIWFYLLWKIFPFALPTLHILNIAILNI